MTCIWCFPRVILYNFWGWGFQLMGFGACGVGPSGFFWVVALYINIKESPGNKIVPFYRPTFITMDIKGGKKGDHNNSTQSKMISKNSADSCV